MPPPPTQESHEVAETQARGVRPTTAAGDADGELADGRGDVELGHSVELEAFSGPLDLLLFLVRRAEVDVIDIPIATIADQFVDTVAAWNELDLDIAGEFILMAATLLEIKARLIAPPLEAPIDEDSGEEDVVDLRAGLVGKLLAYRRFKEAALDLLAREEHQRRRHVRQLREEIPEDPEEAEGIDLDNADPYALASAWELVLKRINGLGPRTVINDNVPLESRVTEMLGHLRASGHCLLNAIFASQPNRIARVTTFMALLECVRQRWIEALQHGQYADVELRFRAEEERAIHEIAFAPEPEAKRRQRRPPLITWEGAPGSETGDEDGEAPEEPQESDEQRFLRELEESSRVDSVLAWSADIELGFARFLAERRGEPWPPPKPAEPEPATTVEAPAAPSWMAARAPARQPRERMEREPKPTLVEPPAVPLAASVETLTDTAPMGPTTSESTPAVAGPATAEAAPALAESATPIEPATSTPLAAAPDVVDASALPDGLVQAVHVLPPPEPAPTAPAITEPLSAEIAQTPSATLAEPSPVEQAAPAPIVAPAEHVTMTSPGSAPTEPKAAVVEPDVAADVTGDAPTTAELGQPVPVAILSTIPEASPAQQAAFADAMPGIGDRVAVRLDVTPADEDVHDDAVPPTAEAAPRSVAPITALVDGPQSTDVAPNVDPALSATDDIELDPIIAPSVAPTIPSEEPPLAAPILHAATSAPAAPVVTTASSDPVHVAPPRPMHIHSMRPAAPGPAPTPPTPSVRTAARREPTAIVMSTGLPADSRAQMRAAVASRRSRHRAIGVSATLLIIAAGWWVWSAADAHAPGTDTETVGGPGSGDRGSSEDAFRPGPIPASLAANDGSIAIDSARLAAIPRLAAWIERVRLGSAVPDLATWTSMVFSDGPVQVPVLDEHGFVMAPEHSIAAPTATAPVAAQPNATPVPVAEASPTVVETPETAIPAATMPMDPVATTVTPLVGPTPVADAASRIPLPTIVAATPVIPPRSFEFAAQTLVRWPADEPTSISGHAPGLDGWIARLYASRHADAFAALLSEGLPAATTVAASAETLPAFRYECEPMMSSSAWLVIHAW